MSAPTLRLAEAASMCGVHPDTLSAMARAGDVPATKIGRSWVFSTRLLQEWIDARCQANFDKAAPSRGNAQASLAERLAGRLAQRITGSETARKRCAQGVKRGQQG